jgi:hypothetical protein
MSPDDARRVSIFATEIPAETVLAALARTSGGKQVNPCGIDTTPPSRLRKHAFRPERTAIEEVRIAGLAQVGEGWKAYAYLPGNRLVPLEPGARFADGSVLAISATGVRFTTKSGTVDVALDR